MDPDLNIPDLIRFFCRSGLRKKKVQTESVIKKERPLQIILAYRPPNSGRENTEELCKLMEDWSGDGILVGDINLPGIDWREK